MKNLPEIKNKLEGIRDKKEYVAWVDSIPESKELAPGIRLIILEGIYSIINKIIKHLDSKKPSKSGITAIISRSFFKLQCEGIRYEGHHCLEVVLTKILNETFEGFFTKRLNVKSKEFLNLEDCEPF